MNLQHSDDFKRDFFRYIQHTPVSTKGLQAITNIVARHEWAFRPDLTFLINPDNLVLHDVCVVPVSDYAPHKLVDYRVCEDKRGNLFALFPCYKYKGKLWKLYLSYDMLYRVDNREDQHFPERFGG